MKIKMTRRKEEKGYSLNEKRIFIGEKITGQQPFKQKRAKMSRESREETR
jgi:hypothetical protein